MIPSLGLAHGRCFHPELSSDLSKCIGTIVICNDARDMAVFLIKSVDAYESTFATRKDDYPLAVIHDRLGSHTRRARHVRPDQVPVAALAAHTRNLIGCVVE